MLRGFLACCPVAAQLLPDSWKAQRGRYKALQERSVVVFLLVDVLSSCLLLHQERVFYMSERVLKHSGHIPKKDRASTSVQSLRTAHPLRA